MPFTVPSLFPCRPASDSAHGSARQPHVFRFSIPSRSTFKCISLTSLGAATRARARSQFLSQPPSDRQNTRSLGLGPASSSIRPGSVTRSVGSHYRLTPPPSPRARAAATPMVRGQPVLPHIGMQDRLPLWVRQFGDHEYEHGSDTTTTLDPDTHRPRHQPMNGPSKSLDAP